MNILIVDDDPVCRRVAVAFCSRVGLVDEAENGLSAVEMVKRTAYDLIVLDGEMPVMGGIEASKAIRQAGITTPMILLSSLIGEHGKCAQCTVCTKCGFDHFLPKPLNRNEMLALLTNIQANGIRDAQSPASDTPYGD